MEGGGAIAIPLERGLNGGAGREVLRAGRGGGGLAPSAEILGGDVVGIFEEDGELVVGEFFLLEGANELIAPSVLKEGMVGEGGRPSSTNGRGAGRGLEVARTELLRGGGHGSDGLSRTGL